MSASRIRRLLLKYVHVQGVSHASVRWPKHNNRSRLRKPDLPNGAGNDEDADVIGEWIGGDDEKPVAVSAVIERAPRDYLVVEERHFNPTAVLDVFSINTFHVSRIAGEIADEEHAFQPRQRNDDTVLWLGVRRRPERKLRARRIEVLRVSFQNLLFDIAHYDLLPRGWLGRILRLSRPCVV